MATLAHAGRRIYYEVAGPAGGPACVLVNGLTQYVKLWHPFRDSLVARGFHVVSYDMLGQGQSDKPSLFIPRTTRWRCSARSLPRWGGGRFLSPE
jgi:3-oxoadipate enol-lactonase